MLSFALKRYLFAACTLALTIVAMPNAFAEEAVSLSGNDAHVTLISPMQRRVYKVELRMDGAASLEAGQRYYVHCEFPNGYQFHECMMGKSLNDCERLTILLPQYRIERGGVRAGDSFELTIGAGPSSATAAQVSNRLTVRWNVADMSVGQVAIHDLSEPRQPTMSAVSPTTMVSAFRRFDVASDGSDLADRVAAMLKLMPGTDGISVASQGQEVRVMGTVDSEAQRQLILDAVRAIPNVEVNDQLTIAAPVSPTEPETLVEPSTSTGIPPVSQKSLSATQKSVDTAYCQEVCVPRCHIRARRYCCP